MSEDTKYAREMGVKARAVRLVGGAKRLRTLGDDFQRVLLKTYRPKQATPQRQIKPPMSMKALGMLPGVPGRQRKAA